MTLHQSGPTCGALVICVLHWHETLHIFLTLSTDVIVLSDIKWVIAALKPFKAPGTDCSASCLGYSLKLKDDLNTNISYWKDIQQIRRLVKLR
jgi:hypothetical protein